MNGNAPVSFEQVRVMLAGKTRKQRAETIARYLTRDEVKQTMEKQNATRNT